MSYIPPMKTLDWYFDFISPFAYLQNAVLGQVASLAEVRRRPILFAGLLSHWGQLGPAEIAPKRLWTFRHCAWLADRHGIPLKMPTMHPFNPLPLLRLSTALGSSAEVVDRLFRYVWIDGHVPSDIDAWAGLLAELHADESVVLSTTAKDALRVAGEEALSAGVFGVPTALIDGQTFWGFDSTAMLLDYLGGSARFTSPTMQAALAMPVGPMRTLPQRVPS